MSAVRWLPCSTCAGLLRLYHFPIASPPAPAVAGDIFDLFDDPEPPKRVFGPCPACDGEGGRFIPCDL